MTEFLQQYGQWIFLAVVFLVMMRLHGSGMGCCGTGHQHKKEKVAEPVKQQEDQESKGPGCH